MSPATEILVIILSVFLAIFLILGIILSIYLIKLTSEIRQITRAAQRTVDSIETAVVGVTRVTSPIFIAELIGRYIKKLKKMAKKGEE